MRERCVCWLLRAAIPPPEPTMHAQAMGSLDRQAAQVLCNWIATDNDAASMDEKSSVVNAFNTTSSDEKSANERSLARTLHYRGVSDKRILVGKPHLPLFRRRTHLQRGGGTIGRVY